MLTVSVLMVLKHTTTTYFEGSSGTYISARSGTGGDLPYEYETYIDARDGYSIVNDNRRAIYSTSLKAVLRKR